MQVGEAIMSSLSVYELEYDRFLKGYLPLHVDRKPREGNIVSCSTDREATEVELRRSRENGFSLSK
jgi:hypothetical protein